MNDFLIQNSFRCHWQINLGFVCAGTRLTSGALSGSLELPWGPEIDGFRSYFVSSARSDACSLLARCRVGAIQAGGHLRCRE